jgi:hypothetical protein
MGTILQTLGTRKAENKFGIETKKLERTGEKTFVVHAEGGNHFEGTITNPNAVKFKDSGRVTFTSIGVCLKKCLNRDKQCSNCVRFSKLREVL